MRWRHDADEPSKDGTTRSRFVFAWKKTRVGEFIVWLESYEIHETYFLPENGAQGWWAETGRNTVGYYYP